MMLAQPGILQEETRLARYLSFSIADAAGLPEVLDALGQMVEPTQTVTGIGPSLAAALGHDIPGLKPFEARSSGGIDIPSTQSALWLWLRGDDRGELLHRSRELEQVLEPVFELEDVLDSFQYDDNRDLTGYVDGTENPKGEDAVAAAVASGQGAGLDGGSYVAVQQWLHDLDRFGHFPETERDHIIGRRQSDNGELGEAPESAHIKRTAQESFDPEAFIVRRSMPWADGMSAGLNFIAFGKSLDAYETLLNHMLGRDDGVIDSLFRFTRPVSGAYYWCPPVREGVLDLRALGL